MAYLGVQMKNIIIILLSCSLLTLATSCNTKTEKDNSQLDGLEQQVLQKAIWAFQYARQMFQVRSYKSLRIMTVPKNPPADWVSKNPLTLKEFPNGDKFLMSQTQRKTDLKFDDSLLKIKGSRITEVGTCINQDFDDVAEGAIRLIYIRYLRSDGSAFKLVKGILPLGKSFVAYNQLKGPDMSGISCRYGVISSDDYIAEIEVGYFKKHIAAIYFKTNKGLIIGGGVTGACTGLNKEHIKDCRVRVSFDNANNKFYGLAGRFNEGFMISNLAFVVNKNSATNLLQPGMKLNTSFENTEAWAAREMLTDSIASVILEKDEVNRSIENQVTASYTPCNNLWKVGVSGGIYFSYREKVTSTLPASIDSSDFDLISNLQTYWNQDWKRYDCVVASFNNRTDTVDTLDLKYNELFRKFRELVKNGI